MIHSRCYRARATALKLLFGGMLFVLAAVLFEAHRHGSAIAGTPLERFAGGDDELRSDGGTPVPTPMDGVDRVVAGFGGAMAGFVAIAIGELTQTLLTVRKRVSVRVSTGTSAAVLHGTIVAALVTNLLLLRYAPPSFRGHEVTVPFGWAGPGRRASAAARPARSSTAASARRRRSAR